MKYTELQVTTNFSFLRGGSHPEEMVEQAVALGYEAIGITDRNTMAGVVRGTKVMSQPSTFDSAALETVRAWRFDIPRRPAGAEQVFVYAVVGFREPITQ